MQFTKPYKEAIAAGDITVSYRAWKKPQAKIGGQYNIPPFGAFEVTEVKELELGRATRAQLAKAGYTSADEVAKFLKVRLDTTVYEVTFAYLGSAPVNKPTTTKVSSEETETILTKLARMDKSAPWTTYALTAIRDQPGRRAGDLATGAGMDTPTFKRNVRKLKALGLTHSLEVGYELSPRGQQIVAMIDKE